METVAWTQVDDEAMSAYIDLAEVSSSNEWSVAYALTQLNSPEARSAQLRVGGGDVRVWLNREEVLTGRLGRQAVLDRDIVPVNLKPVVARY